MKFFIEYPFILGLIIPVMIALIILMKKSFIKFKNQRERSEYEKHHKGRRIFIIISRCLIALYLLIALSSPYTLKEEIAQGDYSLKILADNSTSMDLFDMGVVDGVFDGIKEKIPVIKVLIGCDKASPIGDALINNMQGDDNVLLITDGRNNKGKNLGHVMFFANILNTTISAINLDPVNDDYSVVIEGPSEAIIGTDNEFFIRLNKAGKPPSYSLSVTVDDVPVNAEKIDTNLYRFSKKFTEGHHRITAAIQCNDYFKENNIYYKTLHVLPKPNILYVSDKDSQLFALLNPVYNIDKKDKIAADDLDELNGYSAIIIDDINSGKLESKTDLLSDYVIEGGGLFVIGGENSFDEGDYANSLFETILPVRVGEAGYGGELDTSIVFVIDISGSRNPSVNNYYDVNFEKALVLEIIKDLSLYYKVGVVAYNNKGYNIFNLGLLGEMEDSLIEKVSKLNAPLGGGTNTYAGLLRAKRMLETSLGNKNIVLLSDGNEYHIALNIYFAKELAEQNIKIYTVGVGVCRDSDKAFLQTLSTTTGAAYFEPTSLERLKIIFGGREGTPPEATETLVLFNNNHFITKGLDINADITGFNYVVKKSSSQMLVSLGDGKPVMTVWRYGLGRVVALSTDDGSKWASQLLSTRNSKLFTRGLNWAIGDPQKNLELYIRVSDTNLGGTSKISIKSDKEPVSNKLEFAKSDEDIYIAYFTPEKTGYEEFFNAQVAVNYPIEYQEIGFNKELKEHVALTGGRMFDSSETEELVEFIKDKSIRKKTLPNYIRWPFIAIALAILIIEIFIRKIVESIRRVK